MRASVKNERMGFMGLSFGLLLAFLLLAPAIEVAAQEYVLTVPGKGLYSAGRSYFFDVNGNSGIEWQGGSWNGEFNRETYGGQDLDGESYGSVGGCVFDSALYAFFTVQSGRLEYVKVNPSTGKAFFNSPKTIATGISPNGAAAAVLGGRIYVFTASDTFYSTDGSHYTRQFSGPSGADTILDAVAFYPPDDAPPLPDSKVLGAIMVFYTNSDHLEADVFQGPSYGFSGAPMVLPNPLSDPVAEGNCILGTSGGNEYCGFSAGSKNPCIQFYGCGAHGDWEENVDYEYGRWEYDQKTGEWNAEQVQSGSTTAYALPGLIVAPWFETVDAKSGTLRLDQLVWPPNTGEVEYDMCSNGSDYEVPVYSDNNWQGKYTDTSASSPGTDLANLWTMVGVVLGPPPFPTNGATDFCQSPQELSSVNYGKSDDTSVSTESTSSSTISIASETKIEAGLGELDLGLSYAHAWTSSHGTSTTTSTSVLYHFGPCLETGTQGIHGWVIYDAPILATQRYKLYAYDYKHSDGSGTYLGQSVYTTSTASISQTADYFELQDPSKGGESGLMAGMPLYPNSTDVQNWYQVGQQEDWDSGGANWSVLFKSPRLLAIGSGGSVEFSETNTTVDSKGNSNSFGVEAGASLEIEGFSEGLTVGYEGEWETSTDVEVSVTKSVGSDYEVPVPSDPQPGYVTQMHVQPYWLQAKTAKAPWIPKNYSGNLPWCITWGVTDITTVDGTTSGQASPPGLVEGSIHHGKTKAKDTFQIDGGPLSWKDSEGGLTPIPLTADQFDPSRGASIALNGHIFFSDLSKGKWVRSGDVWNYKTRQDVKNDPFTLSLDFAAKTWSFKGASKTLDQAIKASLGKVSVDITVENSYRFTSRVYCGVECSWNHKDAKGEWQASGVHRIQGDYNSTTGAGDLAIKGHIPKRTASYGDVEVIVNGATVDLPLLSTDGFLRKLENGGVVDYVSDGIIYRMNFGTGRWRLQLSGAQFTDEMAPRDGAIRVQVKVGGVTTSDQTVQLSNTETGLTYAG